MRVKTTKTNSTTSYYIIKDIKIDNKRTTQIVEKLGNHEEIMLNHKCSDPLQWAKERANTLTLNANLDKKVIIRKYNSSKRISKNIVKVYNGGYLFLQDIYYTLGLDSICKKVQNDRKFTYNLNSILSTLIYGQIIDPCSKRSLVKLASTFIEQPKFEEQHLYRALSVLAQNSDYIQAQLYKNSKAKFKRNDKVLYYDCTNFYFEINEEDDDGLRKYGKSKENKPNPIVTMGLFMDADGIPLSFCIQPGNESEQPSLKPLEKQIIKDFGHNEFVVCTDAGLSSTANRKFNNTKKRSFITTQSVKKLKKHLKEWALSDDGWSINGSDETCKISEIDESDPKMYNTTFYKSRWISENELEQRLIISYSIKYKNFKSKIREGQIDRAKKMMMENPKKLKKASNKDYRRFIKATDVTKDGETAAKTIYTFLDSKVSEEEKYDGLYGVCTNLEDELEDIIKINKQRWEIEECFKIMKSEFKARPVHLSREDRIKSHFMVCFLALVHYRYLEKIIDNTYTSTEILSTIRKMNFEDIQGEGYAPLYERTDLTDIMHDKFGFNTDYEIVSKPTIKKILKKIRNNN